MDDKYIHSKLHDVAEALFTYKATSKGKIIPGKDDVLTRYKEDVCIETRLVPAPWPLVILFAFCNAIAVCFVRIAWIDFFGHPGFFAYSPRAEERLNTPEIQP